MSAIFTRHKSWTCNVRTSIFLFLFCFVLFFFFVRLSHGSAYRRIPAGERPARGRWRQVDGPFSSRRYSCVSRSHPDICCFFFFFVSFSPCGLDSVQPSTLSSKLRIFRSEWLASLRRSTAGDIPLGVLSRTRNKNTTHRTLSSPDFFSLFFIFVSRLLPVSEIGLRFRVSLILDERG